MRGHTAVTPLNSLLEARVHTAVASPNTCDLFAQAGKNSDSAPRCSAARGTSALGFPAVLSSPRPLNRHAEPTGRDKLKRTLVVVSNPSATTAHSSCGTKRNFHSTLACDTFNLCSHVSQPSPGLLATYVTWSLHRTIGTKPGLAASQRSIKLSPH